MKSKSDDIDEGKEKKDIENEDVHWSFKRIAILTSILGLVLFAVFYYFQVKTGEILGEKDASTTGGPQIEIPSKADVDDILEGAQDNISNIDANDIVSSQPQIQQAIEQLEKLTNRDNFKETFCSTICSE